MDFKDFAKKEIKEVFEILDSREEGLDQKEVEKRLKIFGKNEIPEKKGKTIEILFRQIKSPFFYLLIFASILAFFVG